MWPSGDANEDALALYGTALTLAFTCLLARRVSWPALRGGISEGAGALRKRLSRVGSTDDVDPLAQRIQAELQRRNLARAHHMLHLLAFATMFCILLVLVNAPQLGIVRSEARLSSPLQSWLIMMMGSVSVLLWSMPRLVTPRTLDAWYSTLMLILVMFLSPVAVKVDFVHMRLVEVFTVGLAFSAFDLKPSLNVFWVCAIGGSAAATILQQGHLENARGKALNLMLVALALSGMLNGFGNFFARIVQLDLEAQMAMRRELAAAHSVLSSICEVVVELDGSLRFQKQCQSLAEMLILNPQRCVQQESFVDLLVSQDRDIFREQMRKLVLPDYASEPSESDQPQLSLAFHTSMQGSFGTTIKVELFVVCFLNRDRQRGLLVGVREFTDVAPLRPLDGEPPAEPPSPTAPHPPHGSSWRQGLGAEGALAAAEAATEPAAPALPASADPGAARPGPGALQAHGPLRGQDEDSGRPSVHSSRLFGGAGHVVDARELRSLGQRERWLIESGEVAITSEVLGEGGFGVVARGLYQGIEVAVKAPKQDIEDGVDGDRVWALCNELRILRHVRHPNIVFLYGAVLDIAEGRARMWLVMELVSGCVLGKFMRKPTVLGDSLVRASLLSDVARALRYLHEQKPPVVHGDLKDSNIFVQQVDSVSGWRAKLLDFGLARHVSPSSRHMGGTLRWMAPEIISGARFPNEAVDVFSFGRVIFFVATGRLPFQDVHRKELRSFLASSPVLQWPSAASGSFESSCRALSEECCQMIFESRPTMPDVYQRLTVFAELWRTLGASHGPPQGSSSRDQAEAVPEKGRASTDVRRAPTKQHHAADAGSGKQAQRLAVPSCAATNSATIHNLILETMLRFNFVMPAESCCTFHGTVQRYASSVRQIGRMGCRDFLGQSGVRHQCKHCGCIARGASSSESGGGDDDVVGAACSICGGELGSLLSRRDRHLPPQPRHLLSI